MKRLHDIDLMEHADGEAASREVEDQLASDPDARKKVEAIGELGELVRGHLELSADAVPARRFDALWREVDKAIERDAAPATQGDPTGERAAAGPGFWRRVSRWIDAYRGHIITGVVSAGAVAALALVLRTSGGEGRSAPGTGHDAMNTQAISVRPTEIESLDTPGGQGSVFHVNDEDGSSTTVIWVTPDDTVEGI